MEMLIFKEQLLVEIPDSFQKMENDKIAVMYPYDEKPQLLLEEKESRRFCTFSLLETQRLTERQVEGAIQVICKVITSLYPSCLLEEPELMKCEGGTCGWFPFRVTGTEGELFHVMYIFPVNGSMMLGTMGCSITDEQGKKQMMKMMESLKVMRKVYEKRNIYR